MRLSNALPGPKHSCTHVPILYVKPFVEMLQLAILTELLILERLTRLVLAFQCSYHSTDLLDSCMEALLAAPFGDFLTSIMSRATMIAFLEDPLLKGWKEKQHMFCDDC